MSELTLDEKRERLINDLIHLQRLSEDLWQYHPENPDAVPVKESYANLQLEIADIESKLEGLSE